MNQRILLINSAALVVALLGLLGLAPAASRAQGGGAQPYRLYLPSLAKEARPSVFGLEMFRVEEARGLDLVVATNTQWTRRNGLPWRLVEPEEGKGYRWDAPFVVALERELLNASRHNLNLILTIRSSPRWATAPYTADCAPINPAKVEAYTRFLAAAVARYSKPPFNVRYWEIGNEPDYVSAQDSPFGCWGIPGDAYYGGEAYGRVLRAAAAAIKRANPEVKVLNGGLMLVRPYDPARPDDTVGRFFEGMLRAGAGDAIDIVSFHAYIYYDPRQPGLSPRSDWRVDYLRGLMRQYGVPEKPLIRTESAMLCPVITAACRWAQADFMARLYARSMRDGLLGNLWFIYDSDGFHSAALVDPGDGFLPRPAYFAYRQTATVLGGSGYIGPIVGLPPAAEGYRFAKDEATIYVFWADEPAEVALPVSAAQRAECYDRDGGRFACARRDGRLTLPASSSPTFVVLR